MRKRGVPRGLSAHLRAGSWSQRPRAPRPRVCNRVARLPRTGRAGGRAPEPPQDAAGRAGSSRPGWGPRAKQKLVSLLARTELCGKWPAPGPELARPPFVPESGPLPTARPPLRAARPGGGLGRGPRDAPARASRARGAPADPALPGANFPAGRARTSRRRRGRARTPRARVQEGAPRGAPGPAALPAPGRAWTPVTG